MRLNRPEMDNEEERSVTRSELIDEIAAAYPELDRDVIERVVESVFGEISQALCDGGRVELRGFGAFWVKERKSRKARNPRTGEAVFVPRRYSLAFKAGRLLRDQLNERV